MFIKFKIHSNTIDFIQDNNRVIDEVTKHVEKELEYLLITTVETYVNPVLKIGVVDVLYRSANCMYPSDIIDLTFSVNEDTYFIEFLR